jgi:hypothetical protein
VLSIVSSFNEKRQFFVVKETYLQRPLFSNSPPYILSNKVPGIRAALCGDAETARGARWWNDANALFTEYILDLSGLFATI